MNTLSKAEITKIMQLGSQTADVMDDKYNDLCSAHDRYCKADAHTTGDTDVLLDLSRARDEVFRELSDTRDAWIKAEQAMGRLINRLSHEELTEWIEHMARLCKN
jgi:hypothetical protein